MSIESGSDPSALENLSALADGELDSSAAERACSAWRNDPAQRNAWHAYLLIGDVLRSEDLATPPARDAAFLASLSTRLDAEPVVLAPEPRRAGGTRSGRWTWMAPATVAAGFVLVTGALLVTRSPLTGTPGAPTTLAGASASVAPAQAVTAPSTLVATDMPAEPRAVGANGKLLRDPRLDRYLSAHQQFAGSSALGVPSGFLRNAVAEVPTR